LMRNQRKLKVPRVSTCMHMEIFAIEGTIVALTVCSYFVGESSSLKRASKLSATEILDQRFTKKTELKEKELELRRMELELQKRKMEGEEEERKQRLQLELEERRALLELLKKHL